MPLLVIKWIRGKTKETHNKAKEQSKNNQVEGNIKAPQTGGKRKHIEVILDDEDQDQPQINARSLMLIVDIKTRIWHAT